MALTLTSVFADLPDPRTETANKIHTLADILTIATCAVIAGAEGWEDIAEYGRSKEAFFRRFLELKNGIPSHDTFYRVFTKLDPDAFADRFARWVAGACETTGLTRPDIDGPAHVAVDGKSARRSAKPTSSGCLHLVEVWDVGGGLILGPRSVPEGGHEITTFRDVPATLDLAGAVVTMDAAGCQAETLDLIRERGGEYVVCVKGNQPTLRGAIAGVFDRAAESEFAGCDGHASIGGAHGRHEERCVTVVHDPEGVPAGWSGVGSVALVCRDRRVEGKANGGHRPLLPEQPAGGGGGTGRVHPPALAHRVDALGSGRGVPGGRQPDAGRSRGCQPGDDPAGGRVPAQAGREEGEHPHPTTPGRMGRPVHGSSDPRTLHA